MLLDLLYQELDTEHLHLSPLAADAYRSLYRQPGARSVRERKALLAQWIDTLAEQVPDAHVLSVACGHLREAHETRAVQERRLGRFVALDQDAESLAAVNRDLRHLGIEPVQGSVRALLNGKLRFDRLDAIYAAGLYDYLPQPVAIQLTRLLFEMLRPGGRLLLANFADKNPDLGYKAYMEAFMDWWLIYRHEADLEEWAKEVPKRGLSHSRVFHDGSGHILYLEMTHR